MTHIIDLDQRASSVDLERMSCKYLFRLTVLGQMARRELSDQEARRMRVNRLVMEMKAGGGPEVKVFRTSGEIAGSDICKAYAKRVYHPTKASAKRIEKIHKVLWKEPFANGYLSTRKNGMIVIFARERESYTQSLKREE